jgi:hypothetical protein
MKTMANKEQAAVAPAKQTQRWNPNDRSKTTTLHVNYPGSTGRKSAGTAAVKPGYGDPITLRFSP